MQENSMQPIMVRCKIQVFRLDVPRTGKTTTRTLASS